MTMTNDGLLAGKVAIITGASRGIGEAIAVRYAMEGVRVAVAARTASEGDHPLLPGSIGGVAERITRAGGQAIAVRCDLSDEADREALVRTTESELGPVDILVNNGAVTYFTPVEEFTEKRFKLMLEVQVYAALHLAQLVLPGMRERESGWIVNMSSGAAIHPEPSAGGGRGNTVYGMCKAALERFSTGLAAEVNDAGIAVNAIQPGTVATPGMDYFGLITDENRHLTTPVEHVAEACLRLSHNQPERITGQIVTAKGMVTDHALEPVELPT